MLLSSLACFLQHVQHQPDARAVTFLVDGEQQALHWTYGQLHARAAHVAQWFAAQKMQASGQRVLLLHPPGLDFIAALYGCWMAGVVPVPCALPNFGPNNRAAHRLSALAADAGARVVLSTAAKLTAVITACSTQPALQTLLYWASDTPYVQLNPDTPDAALPAPAESNNASFASHLPSPQDIALIQYTSGSTGTPRGVVVTHSNMAHNQAAIAEKMGLSPSSVVVSWLPQYHDMGLIGGILNPLTVGYPVVLMDPAHFMARPARWLQAISRYRATTSGAPDFAYALCARALKGPDLAGLDLSCWRVAFSGAEPVRSTSLDAFAHTVAPAGFNPRAYYPCYGLAESTLLASGGQHGDGAERIPLGGQPLVACGTPASGHTLLVVDEQRRVCAPGVTGEIWLAGSSVAQGYWHQPELSQATFCARLQVESGTNQNSDLAPLNFLRTGDLGCIVNGQLVVQGRLKDLIIVRGRNVYPQDIEACANRCSPMFADSVAFAIDSTAHADADSSGSQQLVVACELRREHRRLADPAQRMHEVRTALAREMDLHVALVLLLPPTAIVRTTSGKVRRSACRDAYVAGHWQQAVDAAASASALDAANAQRQSQQLGEDVLAAMQTVAQQAAQVLATPPGAKRQAALAQYLTRRTAQLLGMVPSRIASGQPLHEQGIDSLLTVELKLLLQTDLSLPLHGDVFTLHTTIHTLAADLDAQLSALGSSSLSLAAKPQTFAVGTVLPMTPLEHTFFTPALTRPERFFALLHVRLPVGTDMPRLEAAVRGLEQRFEAFQTCYVLPADGPWQKQVAAPGAGVLFTRLDATATAPGAIRSLGERLYNDTAAGFDLARGTLVQATWLDCGPAKVGVFTLAFHHLAIDATSLAVVMLALEQAYKNRDSTPAAPSPPSPSLWQWTAALQAFGQSKAADADLPYWQAVCRPAANPPAAEKVVDKAADAENTDRGLHLLRHSVAPSVSHALLQHAHSSQALQNAFVAALVYAHQQLFAKPRLWLELENHGRSALPATESASDTLLDMLDAHNTVGWLATRYPVVFDPPPQPTWATAAAQVKRAMAQLPHHGKSYGLLHMQGRPGLAFNPDILFYYRGRLDSTFRADALFPVFNVQHMNQAHSAPLGQSSVPLLLSVRRSNDGFDCLFNFDKQAYSIQQVMQLIALMESALQAME